MFRLKPSKKIEEKRYCQSRVPNNIPTTINVGLTKYDGEDIMTSSTRSTFTGSEEGNGSSRSLGCGVVAAAETNDINNNYIHDVVDSDHSDLVVKASSSSSKKLADIIYASSTCETRNMSNRSTSNSNFFFDSNNTIVKTADSLLKLLTGVDDIRVSPDSSSSFEEWDENDWVGGCGGGGALLYDENDCEESINNSKDGQKKMHGMKTTAPPPPPPQQQQKSVGEKRLNTLLREISFTKTQSKVFNNPKPILMERVPSSSMVNSLNNSMDSKSLSSFPSKNGVTRTIIQKKGLKRSTMSGKGKNAIELNRSRSFVNGKAVRLLNKKK